MGILSLIVNRIAPIFIIVSPITSYADQIWSIHKTRSSAGFSLDIPLIMLVASILRIYYWLGARFDTSLLIQSLIMIFMQVLLLRVALENRPWPGQKGSIETLPFADSRNTGGFLSRTRPFRFWQWRGSQPYWDFLLYFTLTLLLFQLLLSSIPSYISLIGYLALTIEALLPIPQMLSNQRNRSCKGFRFSVLFNWILGDIMKMLFFFMAENHIPWTFRLCGVFQFVCDLGLGGQYLAFGSGENSSKVIVGGVVGGAGVGAGMEMGHVGLPNAGLVVDGGKKREG